MRSSRRSPTAAVVLAPALLGGCTQGPAVARDPTAPTAAGPGSPAPGTSASADTVRELASRHLGVTR